MAKRRTRRREPPIIAAYREWIAHRYDPGYFLGGRIPPYWRRERWNRRGRKWEGIVLIAYALAYLAMSVALAITTLGGGLAAAALLPQLLLTALLVVAGLKLFGTPSYPRRPRGGNEVPER